LAGQRINIKTASGENDQDAILTAVYATQLAIDGTVVTRNEAETGAVTITLFNDNAGYIWSAFEFLSQFCSAFSLGIFLSQSGTSREFILTLDSQTPYPFTDSETFDKNTDKVTGSPDGYRCSIVFDPVRANYASITETPLVEQDVIYDGRKKETLIHPNNFIFPYRDLRVPETDGEIYSMYDSGDKYWYKRTCCTLRNLAGYGVLNAKIRAQIFNFDTLEVESPYKIANTVRAKENKIDLYKRDSKYFQEIYRT
jgi:hypothetical protein